jgi:protein-S-isoprenylcysteine O-methyltransferase Ste14
MAVSSALVHEPPQLPRRLAVATVNVTLAFLWTWFAASHVNYWLASGNARVLPLVALEGIIAVLFLTRREAVAVVASAPALAATLLGTFAPFAMAPRTHHSALAPVWSSLVLVGVVCALGSAVSLGRSFGLVPANRGIRTNGLYRIVRHPLYASYAIAWIGYVGLSPTVRNATIVAAALSGQFLRIRLEERVLFQDPAYAAYADRTRYRLVPRVY